MTALSSSLKTQGVHVLGDFISKCGLSQSACDVLEVLRSLNLPVEVQDLPLFSERDAEKQQLGPLPLAVPTPASRVSLVNLNADFMPALAEMLPRHFFEDRYVIGIWYWETEVFPAHQRVGFDYVDEVWVASRHIREALERVSPVPVRQFTHLIHPPRAAGREMLPSYLNNGRFVFLFCFDFRSMAERKNPAGACGAFVRAFPEASPHGPLFVIKSVAGYPENSLELLDLRRRFRHRPDIVFMDGWLPFEQRDALMNRADCYVSLHRAEGLGLTILESMSLGKPCIGTAYSGNMDFMTPENSWLIPFRLVSVGWHRWPFAKEHFWADPDLDAAAAAMREAYGNPAMLQEKSRQARETIALRHGAGAVAETLRPLLEDAILRPARVKPGLAKVAVASGSPRAQAYEVLKRTKAAHKAACQQVRQLGGWKIPPGLRDTLTSILEIQQLQLDTHGHILRELGHLKNQIRGYEQGSFERLLLDQQRTGLLIRDLTAGLAHDPEGSSGP